MRLNKLRAVRRSQSRAVSYFSAGDSTNGDEDYRKHKRQLRSGCLNISKVTWWRQDSDEEPDDGKLPLIWQMNLAEQQMCEPECLQLLHEYGKLLEVWQCLKAK